MTWLSPPTPTRSPWLRGSLLAGPLFVLALLVAGCDAADGTQEASAELPTSALAKGDDTVIIPAPGSTKGDFLLYPVHVPPGGEFIIELISGPSPYAILGSVLHRGLQDGRTEVEVDMSGMGGLFTVEMRLDQTVRYSSTPMASSQPQAVGSLEEKPTSFHFEIIEEGDEQVIVVAVDYDREAMGGDGIAWITPEAGGPPVPSTYLDILPQDALGSSVEIAAVRMRGIGTGEIVIDEQYVE